MERSGSEQEGLLQSSARQITTPTRRIVSAEAAFITKTSELMGMYSRLDSSSTALGDITEQNKPVWAPVPQTRLASASSSRLCTSTPPNDTSGCRYRCSTTGHGVVLAKVIGHGIVADTKPA